MEAVPLSAPRHNVASYATRLPLSPHCNPFFARNDSLGDFHHSPSVSLASFAGRVSESRGPPIAPAGSECGLASHSPYPRKAGYICTQRYGPRRPMHRIAGLSAVSYTGRKYRDGSTSVHKNRSPRKQGRNNHAIGKRPESASALRALPPSTHPRLGVSSRHQRFHRCALQRIFRPSFGNGSPD